MFVINVKYFKFLIFDIFYNKRYNYTCITINFKRKKMMIKRLVLILLISNVIVCFSACAGKGVTENNVKEPKKIIVFAAASLTEAFTEIGNEFMKENPDTNIIFNFDSSGTLKTQIEEGATCDIFVSAAPKQMNQLEELGLIKPDTRFDFLENKVALVVTDENKKNINSYEDLVKGLNQGNILLAIGNSDVPVGQYTQKIFTHFGLDEKRLSDNGVLSYGSNVKEVTIQVKEGTVDCGIVYGTDANSANLKVVDYATKDMCGQVLYPASLLKKSNDYSIDFLNYLKKEKAKNILIKVGFSPLT